MGAAAVVAGVYFGSVPNSYQLASVMPQNWADAISADTIKQFDSKANDAPKVLATLNRILVRLVGREESKNYTMSVTNDAFVNAFALPSGNIYFTKEFLLQASNGEEIAGVLAHEVQHVIQRYSAARLLREKVLGLVAQATFGGANSGTWAKLLGTLKFSREDEANADRGAVPMLDQAVGSAEVSQDFLYRGNL